MTSKYIDETDVWNCDPDLESGWRQFANDCETSARDDLTSDLWMKFYRSGVSKVDQRKPKEKIMCSCKHFFSSHSSQQRQGAMLKWALRQSIKNPLEGIQDSR